MAGGYGIPVETLEVRLKRSCWLGWGFALAVVTASGLGGCSSGNGNAIPMIPTPIMTNLFPSNVTAGSQGFTMFITGNDFIQNSQGVTFAYWNGSARSTTLNAQTGELEVVILPSDVAAPGTATLSVANPPPGGSCLAPGGNCGTNTFTIVMPQAGDPMITSFSPASVKAGGMPFTLEVDGSNFAVGDVVVWNSQQRPATFVTQGKMTVAITAQDIFVAGLVGVAVSQPGLIRASLTTDFPVVGSSSGTPSIGSLTPNTIAAGSDDFQMVVKGSRFAPNCFVEWNGVPRATAFASSSQIVALIPAADVLSAGTVNVTVTNPATVATPGGGTSGAATFTISH
jgi:hypothetical protein